MNVQRLLSQLREPERFEPGGLVLGREMLEELIAAACKVPAEGSPPPWRFVVVKDRAVRERLYEPMKRRDLVREASALLVVCGTIGLGKSTEAKEARDEHRRSASLDQVMLAVRSPSMAAMALILLAAERGIGVKVVYDFDAQGLVDVLGIPPGLLPISVLAMGLPATNAPDPARPAPDSCDRESVQIVYHEVMDSSKLL